MSYRNMKIAVGLFVSLFAILIVAITYLILDKKGFFEDKYSFDFYAKSAQSLHLGMSLNFSGFEIGQISNIELTDDGKVHAVFQIKKSNHKWICEDTLLLLSKPLIGSASINVMTSLGYPKLEPNSTLNMFVLDDINDMINNAQPIIKELLTIVSSVDKITSDLAKEDGDLRATTRNIRNFTQRLSNDKGLITTITGDEKSSQALHKVIKESSDVMEQMKLLSLKIDAILGELHKSVITPSAKSMSLINDILFDVKSKLYALDGTVNAIGSSDKEILQIKEEIGLGLSKTNKMLEKIDAILQTNESNKVVLP